MFNRRGISDIVTYDEAAIEERFGLPPAKYLDYVALKGDPSDNIPGVPGVGEKTASKLVQEFGSVEELLARTDELKGKLRENVEAAADRLTLNKELARIVTDVELPVGPEDLVMGEWDLDEVRRLFTSLEFRTLLDRLEEVGRTAKPEVEVADLDLREVPAAELAGVAGTGTPVGVRLDADREGLHGAALSAGGAQAAYASMTEPAPIARWLARRRTRRSGRTTRRSSRRRPSRPVRRSPASRSTRCWPATCWTRPPPSIRCGPSASGTSASTCWATWTRRRRGSCSPRRRGGPSPPRPPPSRCWRP